MANGSHGLGKGLGALLGSAALETEPSEAHTVPLSQIERNVSQPRRRFDENSLADLAASIQEHGIIQPLLVRQLSSGYYQIIAGERRWRAARIAGLQRVPVVVIEADDRKVAELALIENLQREDLNPIEEAEGYRALMEKYHMTQEEAATRVGKSRSSIANSLRLLGLTPHVRGLVEEGRLTNGHGRALLSLPEEVQKKAADTILEEGLSVRQTEALVKKLFQPSGEKKGRQEPTTLAIDYVKRAEDSLTEHLGRPCRIVNGKRKGYIELEYYGTDDLNLLLDALTQLCNASQEENRHEESS